MWNSWLEKKKPSIFNINPISYKKYLKIYLFFFHFLTLPLFVICLLAQSLRLEIKFLYRHKSQLSNTLSEILNSATTWPSTLTLRHVIAPDQIYRHWQLPAEASRIIYSYWNRRSSRKSRWHESRGQHSSRMPKAIMNIRGKENNTKSIT